MEQICAAIMQERTISENTSKLELEQMYQNPEYKVFEFPPFEIISVDLNTFTNTAMKNRNFRDILIGKRN